jgi:hypothetical protein
MGYQLRTGDFFPGCPLREPERSGEFLITETFVPDETKAAVQSAVQRRDAAKKALA